MEMDTWLIVLLIAVGALVLVATVTMWFVLRNRRTETLKHRFGEEYANTLDAFGSRPAAEADLVARTQRVKKLAIQPLSAGQRDRFAVRWRRAQATFVDDPVEAVAEADALVEEVMEARGYPVAEFDQRAEDISVDHPRLVQNYREAHAVAVSARHGRARTEDLRRATLYFRELFEDLLERATRRTAEVPR